MIRFTHTNTNTSYFPTVQRTWLLTVNHVSFRTTISHTKLHILHNVDTKPKKTSVNLQQIDTPTNRYPIQQIDTPTFYAMF